MSKHGHWFAVFSPSGVHIGLWDDGKIAADVQAETPGSTKMELLELTPARLAAEDMLEALEALLKLHEAHHNNPEHARARAAISKATLTRNEGEADA